MKRLPSPKTLHAAIAAAAVALFAAPAHCFSGGSSVSALERHFAEIEEMLAAGDGPAAALEYRRLATKSDDPAFRASLHVLAADAYLSAKNADRASRMLDLGADDADGDTAAAAFLRLNAAETRGEWISAALYAETLRDMAETAGDAATARYASGAQAADALLAGEIGEARAAVARMPEKLAVVEQYAARRDKSPRLGGILGLVPGLGYAYSGEWGNMVRSMILNGLFGWAMYECAANDEWGLFAVSSFFELTWYTGSIYGGIDAAHRHNRERLENAAAALRERPEPSVRRAGAIPAVSVELAF